ncbi:TetR/AcrR family transcriptional regulator [Novosphingobium sp.]|uniref:TetR/AcrR family transcriptional regulator n=1 Tax=Novosphingobium sp. TaxID=1874826 RepID=UPI002614FC2F|nr:TetR/AcrR family transcriptional regulator [Novosphingobium sp.]
MRIDRRRELTRAAILKAGQRLFAERAMDSVSIDDIVSTAEVAKGSFYNHFDDKEGLAHAIVELVQGDCEFHIFAANKGMTDAARRMVRAMCVTLRYARAHPERLQALISLSERRTIATSPLNAGVSTDVAEGLEQGVFAGVTLEVGVLIALGIVRTAVVHVMTEAFDRPLADLGTVVGAALLRALGTPADSALTIAAETTATLLEEPTR